MLCGATIQAPLLCLKQCRLQILHGFVTSQNWMVSCTLTLPNTERTLLRARIDRAHVVAGLEARGRDRAIVAQVAVPARTLSVQAQPLRVTIIWAARQRALWANLRLVSANDFTTIRAAESDVASAFTIEAETVAGAVICTSSHRIIQ